MSTDAVTQFDIDPEVTDVEIASRAVDYMIAEYAHKANLFGYVARATPGGRRPKNPEGWQIRPPFDTPEVRAWMVDVLLAGHSISVYCDREKPTLNLGTLAVIRRRARQQREARR
jgi:hypothetical protein